MGRNFRNFILKILGIVIFGFLFYYLDIIHRLDIINSLQFGFFLIVIIIIYIIKQLM